jgi:uncharacterized protein (DUF302 family)
VEVIAGSEIMGKREEVAMGQGIGKGIAERRSQYTVDETVERLKRILAGKGVTLFTVVDHSGEAEKVGMSMPPTKLAIFGNPKAGTPLMLAAPNVAIDLPLKILVREDGEGKVWLSWNTAEYLLERHGLAAEFRKILAVVEGLAAEAGTQGLGD